MEKSEFDDVLNLVNEQRQEGPSEESNPSQNTGKITYSEEQRLHIDSLIKDAMGRAGREWKTRALTAEEKLATNAPQAPEADLVTRLATTQAELNALKRSQADASIADQIRRACGDRFVDTDLAVEILRRQVRHDGGKLEVINPDGTPRLTATLETATLQDAVAALVTEKPFLARGRALAGTGATYNATPHSGSDAELKRLFDPQTGDVAARNRMALKDRRTYDRLKAQAKVRGII